MSNYQLRARSTTPGDYNFIAGRLAFLALASEVKKDVDIGDGTLGTYALVSGTSTGSLSSFYPRMQATANRMLDGKGQIVAIKHSVVGEYVPGEGTTNTITTQAGTGAVVEWDARQVDGTLILTGDKRLMLSALNTDGDALVSPVLGDTVTDAAGRVYTLTAPLETLSPAGTVVSYTCNLRGA